MIRWSVRLGLILFFVLAFPFRSPAPLVYTPGEGWTYEEVGAKGKWQRARAKDQLQVATDALAKKNFKLALKAAKRVVQKWPFSDYAPRAQFDIGLCYEARHMDQKAFTEFQKLIEKYPKIDNFQEVLQHEYTIASRFLAGEWIRLWGYIPLFPSMDKTAEMYDTVVKNGPYDELAPLAQMNIGQAREKEKDYPLAVKAYERAADRYNDRKGVAADAIFKEAMAYYKQAKTAEYDQSVAGQAIATFTDLMTLYPDDPRKAQALKIIAALKTEQANGSFRIARFYEKRKKWNGALVYYNEAMNKDPNSKTAALARQRIEALKKKIVLK